MIYSIADSIGDCYAGFDDRDRCDDSNAGLFVGSLLAYAILRVWDAVDAFAVPPAHNARVRELRARLGMPEPMYTRVTPMLAPTHDGQGGVAGVSLRF